jgi:hypothetical protein
MPKIMDGTEQCDACGKAVEAGKGVLGFDCYFCQECAPKQAKVKSGRKQGQRKQA